MDPSMLANLPAMAPPAGEIPNFVNPPSLAPAGRVVIYVTLPLMVLVLALRLYTRMRITRVVGVDDYFIIAAAASVAAYCGVTLHIFGGGYLGPHQWNVPIIEITPDYIKGAIVVTCLYSATAMLIKVSLLLLYLRIFRIATGALYLVWGGIVTIVVFYLTCIITTSIQCNPNQWPSNDNPLVFLQAQANSNCNHPQLTLSAAQGVFSTVSDVYVLTVPVIFVSGLRLSIERKIGVCAIFTVGFLAAATSIATCVFRFQQRNSDDFSWYSAINMILGAAELNTGIMCACMPVCFVLFKSALSSPWESFKTYLQGRRSRKSGSGSQGNSSNPDLIEKGSHNGLPRIPGAVMTGLRTFIRGGRGDHYGPNGSVNVQTEMSMHTTYTEVGSVDEEYHRQLRKLESNTPPSSRERSSV